MLFLLLANCYNGLEIKYNEFGLTESRITNDSKEILEYIHPSILALLQNGENKRNNVVGSFTINKEEKETAVLIRNKTISDDLLFKAIVDTDQDSAVFLYKKLPLSPYKNLVFKDDKIHLVGEIERLTEFSKKLSLKDLKIDDNSRHLILESFNWYSNTITIEAKDVYKNKNENIDIKISLIKVEGSNNTIQATISLGDKASEIETYEYEKNIEGNLVKFFLENDPDVIYLSKNEDKKSAIRIVNLKDKDGNDFASVKLSSLEDNENSDKIKDIPSSSLITYVLNNRLKGNNDEQNISDNDKNSYIINKVDSPTNKSFFNFVDDKTVSGVTFSNYNVTKITKIMTIRVFALIMEDLFYFKSFEPQK